MNLWKRRPMRSNLASLRRVPKRSTSERTSPQSDTKNWSSLRISERSNTFCWWEISATNFFTSWRSVEFELIRLALAAELDPECSAASISIIVFGLICSMGMLLKIGIKKRTEHLFISERKYLLLLPLSSFVTSAGGSAIFCVLNDKWWLCC